MSARTIKSSGMEKERRGKEQPHAEAASLDDALLRRLRARDRSAQAELFRRHHRALSSHALGVIRNRALAEEVVQEAWMKAMARIDSFEGRCSFRTWMTSIVINEAKMKRKREARSSLLSSFERQGRSQPDGDADWHDWMVGANDETPEWLLLRREAEDRLQGALSALSITQRSVVVLRDFQGASPEEACDALAITDLAQRVHLCRARATIRRAIEADERLCA